MKSNLVYEFTLPDQRKLTYRFQFDGERYLIDREVGEPEPWCELKFQQCSHCPYQDNGPKFCPAASQLSLIVKDVDHLVSYDRIHLRIESKQRIIEQESSVQEAVSSLLGLVLASCGCPHTEFLLPMARFHLPLASAEETLWRACGNFLLAQHFKAESGSSTEMLGDILRRYGNLEVINSALVKRLKSQINSDACPNAIVLLD